MNFLMFFWRLRRYFLNLIHCKCNRPKISLLIPFSSNDPSRTANFKWLVKYWKHELPDAEIIIGRSRSRIFCKGEALNHAVRKSKGKVLVILDADAYLPGKVIEDCANLILENLDNHLWYVPYRNLYRLTEAITRYILCTDPEDPYRPPSPPPPEYVENLGHHSSYGHRYGAMIMMFPREAYDLLGCFDERFKGWGGEDVALLRALDTLYGKHKTTKNDVLHLWHPIIGHNYKTRRWDGQTSAGDNFRLASEYNKAIISPARMREIVDEGCKHCHKFL